MKSENIAIETLSPSAPAKRGRPKGEKSADKLVMEASKNALLREDIDKDNIVERASSGCLSLYNNMRCTFNIPNCLLVKGFNIPNGDSKIHRAYATHTKVNILRPGQSVEIDRDLFEAYQSKNKAFRAMISSRNLIIKDNGLKIDNRDYSDIKTAGAPEFLDGYGSKDNRDMVTEPVMTHFSKSRSYDISI
jgi:hypothetical protein